MEKQNASLKFRLKEIVERKKCFLEEIKHNELIGKKILNYIEHLLILASTFTGCDSIFIFASATGFLVGIASSATGLKTCLITAGNKMYKSIIQKKRIKSIIK